MRIAVGVMVAIVAAVVLLLASRTEQAPRVSPHQPLSSDADRPPHLLGGEVDGTGAGDSLPNLVEPESRTVDWEIRDLATGMAPPPLEIVGRAGALTAESDESGRLTVPVECDNFVLGSGDVADGWSIVARDASQARPRLWVARALRITGRVARRDGAPIDREGLSVKVTIGGGAETPLYSRLPDPWNASWAKNNGFAFELDGSQHEQDGTLSLPCAAAQGLAVVVSSPVYRCEVIDVALPLNLGPVHDVGTLWVEECAVLQGRVVASDDTSVAGTRVRVFVRQRGDLGSFRASLALVPRGYAFLGSAPPSDSVLSFQEEVVLGVDGSFRLSVPTAGAVTLMVRRDGYNIEERDFGLDPRSPTEPIEVTMVPKRQVRIQVVAADGRPASDRSVTFVDATVRGLQIMDTFTLDHEGSCRTSFFQSGRVYMVLLAANDAAPSERTTGFLTWDERDTVRIAELDTKMPNPPE